MIMEWLDMLLSLSVHRHTQKTQLANATATHTCSDDSDAGEDE